MTEVKVRRARIPDKSGRGEGMAYFLEAKGHATGSEKVCSGVSAILYALAGWIINNDDKLLYHRERLTSGDAYIEFWGGTEAQTAYDMAVIGLRQIEKKYPEYIKFKKK